MRNARKEEEGRTLTDIEKGAVRLSSHGCPKIKTPFTVSFN